MFLLQRIRLLVAERVPFTFCKRCLSIVENESGIQARHIAKPGKLYGPSKVFNVLDRIHRTDGTRTRIQDLGFNGSNNGNVEVMYGQA
jgi:hypothetical protein